MVTRFRSIHAILLACTLVACRAEAPAQAAPITVAAATQTPPVVQEASVALIPKVIAVQQAIQEAVPTTQAIQPVDELTASLISRWEVGSPALYTSRYQFPLWPGNSSGITIGVGYDLGFTTPFRIEQDWDKHIQVNLLVHASGIVGIAARSVLPQYRKIVTPFSLADTVFRYSTLPSFVAQAQRALGDGFDTLPVGAKAALVSLGYNRGWSFAGSRRSEMRVIRDKCIPAQDVKCIAAQLRSMKRLWPDTKGLRDRREDEANIAER